MAHQRQQAGLLLATVLQALLGLHLRSDRVEPADRITSTPSRGML
jgi:hypothetical protein